MELPSYQQTREFMVQSFAIDLDTDGEERTSLAAIGLTRMAWRNKTIEDAHAEGLVSNAEMMRANIATYRLARSFLASPSIDWKGLAESIIDPTREVGPETPLARLCGSYLPAVQSGCLNTIEASQRVEEEYGSEYLLASLAVDGTNNPEWFGTPWWPEVVAELTITVGFEPSLSDSFLNFPEDLDDEVLYLWMRQSFPVSQKGLKRWKEGRSVVDSLDPP